MVSRPWRTRVRLIIALLLLALIATEGLWTVVGFEAATALAGDGPNAQRIEHLRERLRPARAILLARRLEAEPVQYLARTSGRPGRSSVQEAERQTMLAYVLAPILLHHDQEARLVLADFANDAQLEAWLAEQEAVVVIARLGRGLAILERQS